MIDGVVTFTDFDDFTKQEIINYVKCFLFIIIPEIEFKLQTLYLYIAGYGYITCIIVIISLVLHPIWCYIFIVFLDYNAIGGALSLIISLSLNLILSSLYLYFRNPIPGALFWFNRDCFKNIFSYLKYSVPCLIVLGVTFLAFELTNLIALNCFGDQKLNYASHIVLSNLYMISVAFKSGFNMAIVIDVGYFAGKLDFQNAKRVSKVILIVSMIFTGIIAVLILVVNKYILYIYLKDGEVIENIAYLEMILAPICLCDCLQHTLGSICLALGKQIIAGILSFINMYALFLGLGYILGIYFDLRILGIWLGILIGLFCSCVSYIFLLAYLDYNKLKDDLKKRYKNEKISN
jgi:MATE family multidrug resistance protein